MNDLRRYRNEITSQPGLIVDVYYVAEHISDRGVEEKAEIIASPLDRMTPIVNLAEQQIEIAEQNALELFEDILEGTDERVVVLIKDDRKLGDFHDVAGKRLDDVLRDYNVKEHHKPSEAYAKTKRLEA